MCSNLYSYQASENCIATMNEFSSIGLSCTLFITNNLNRQAVLVAI
uniref:Uncharacterized protein n=1 Tax=Arundo donax TaxID=35708 RepID=A0A0A8Z4I2_ARUDO